MAHMLLSVAFVLVGAFGLAVMAVTFLRADGRL